MDTIIVGAGSAGAVLAARLTEEPTRSVLLVEAGPDFGTDIARLPHAVVDASDLGPTQYDWGRTARLGPTGRESPVFAGRLVGGSSATNNVMALRGQPADYDGWARAGNPGWTYHEVLDAFVRMERDLDFPNQPGHGGAGPVPIRRFGTDELAAHQHAFLAACSTAGHSPMPDHNALGGGFGAGPLPLNALDGVRQSTALTYLARARHRPNLTIWPDTTVDRVLIRNARATGIRLTDNRTVSAGQVILAAGTYGSPAVLFRSGVGPAATLRAAGIPVRHDLPGVGANLHDHPLVRLRFAAFGTPQPAPCQTVLTTESGLQIFPGAITDGPELTVLVALLNPESRGHITPRTIDVGLFTEPTDRARMCDGIEQARDIAHTPPFADHVGAEQTTDSVIETVNVYQHPVGSCRMGPSCDPTAVVDPHAAVYGIDGLAVIDASIMPRIARANTNVSTLMLAEHLASAWLATPPAVTNTSPGHVRRG